MIKFIHPSYCLFAFSLCLLLFLLLHTPEHNTANQGAQIFYRFIAGVLCAYFTVFSVKAFRADLLHATGKKLYDRKIEIQLSKQSSFLVVGPFSGRGRCQFRIRLKRVSEFSSSDEFEISHSYENGDMRQKEVLQFAFDKGEYQINVGEESSWLINVTIRPTKEMNEPFVGNAHIEVFGRAKDFKSPEHVATSVRV